MTAIHAPHSAGDVTETEDKPEMSDTTNHDDVTEWAEELWQRAIDCDGESGPRLISHALRRAAESGDPAARNAPAWVHAVTPAEIVRQRSLKWPDFHPEDFCHQCGRRNPCWFADTEVWQTATGSTGDGGGILCPTCFAALWEGKTGMTAILWRFSIDPRSRDICGNLHGSGETCARPTGHNGQHHSGGSGLGWTTG